VNKTADIEWEIALVLDAGPLTLAEMEQRLPAEIRSEDRRWIGIAVYNMLRDGRIRAVGCDHDSHEGDCVVETVR
jgi:membrane-bound lytic murein transglycosylase MltF